MGILVKLKANVVLKGNLDMCKIFARIHIKKKKLQCNTRCHNSVGFKNK
jgi:uncharacterized membrane protein